MKRISILALCLIAVYAMAAVVAGGVYAEGTPKEKYEACQGKVIEKKEALASKKEEQKEKLEELREEGKPKERSKSEGKV